MKKIVLSFCLIIIVFCSCAQKKPIRLIIRGDDMGYAHAGNEALDKVFERRHSNVYRSDRALRPGFRKRLNCWKKIRALM